ncbi:MAG TPA: type I DNA topoisomerase [Clostridiales bacterium]|nr:type I DNA topoisomerase [Clostridiales bacterium]
MLDRLVGYELSPLLWSKVRKGLSAGRVQSVATKLVVDREKEIEAFVPEEYWNINAELTPLDTDFPFKARYHGEKKNGKIEKVKISSKEETDSLLSKIKDGQYIVDTVKKGRKMRQPFAPFTTSTLQQEASRRISFTSRKTMSVAQQLYEGVEISGQGQVALVSYIRTDSVRVSDEAMTAARRLISEKYGEKYLPKSPRKYSNKNSAQDAHEAIRPAHFELDPESIKSSLSVDQYRLYKLIWDRFLASQMASAEVDTVSLDVICQNSVFRAQGETIKFQGFLAAYADIAEDNAEDDKSVKAKLPELSDGQSLKLLDIKSEQKFTLPPARFTEATLIKTLEEKGIGRPSTYAPTISTILERNYIDKKGKIIYPTDLGKVVTLLLSDNFAEIVDVSFTADMESKLDEIEVGKKDWVKVLSEFYPPFHELIVKAGSAVSKVKMEEKQTGEKCPECGGDLIIKEGRFGQFVACSHFPECKFTRNVEVTVKGSCPLCGSGLVSHRSNKYKGRVFYTCDRKGKDPDCSFISWYLPVEGQKCDTCGSYMVWKRFRGRAYPKCANPECPKNTAKKSSKSEDEEKPAPKEKKSRKKASSDANEA